MSVILKAICILLICCSTWSILLGQESGNKPRRFHAIEVTASSIYIKDWNTGDTTNTSYVMELTDWQGRTKELRFYNSRHQLTYTGSGFYGGPIIRYDYVGNKIIETFYSEENELAHDFRHSEVPYRFVYHLNQHMEIDSIERKYKLEVEWNKEDLDEAIDFLEEYKTFASEGSPLYTVFGYQFAFDKMGGVDPKLAQ